MCQSKRNIGWDTSLKLYALIRNSYLFNKLEIQWSAVLVDDISFFTINKTLHKKATISYQAMNNNFIYYMSMMIAMFFFSRGEQCSENRFTGDCLWRYSWSVLWSQRIVQSRRRCSWHKLPVHGRLCWSWILQRRDFSPSARPESSISWQNLPDQRKSRVPTNYAGRDENGIF